MGNWEIKQDLEHRYLVYKVRQKQEDYRVRMLVHQTAAPLLACRTRRVNGELLLTYDVSGLPSFAQRCETEGMGAELLQALFSAIGRAYERLQSYLLDPDMLVLAPEAIFCSPDDGAFLFCCALAAEEDSFAKLHALSLFLLDVLDREDEKAVQLGYALYRCSLPGKLAQAEVMRLLRAGAGEGKTESPAQSIKAEQMQEPEQSVQAAEAEQEQGFARPAEEKNDYAGAYEKKQEPGWRNGTYAKASPAAPDKTEKPRKKRRAASFFQNLFGGRQEEQPYFPSAYTNALPSYAGEQIFAYGGKSCVLQGQKKELPTFSPTEYPFLIGSLEFGVDGYIDDVTVSRFHARLEKLEDRYYLTDLDSAHGTKRNGEPLPPQTKAELRNGDEIRFGRTRFRFVITE